MLEILEKIDQSILFFINVALKNSLFDIVMPAVSEAKYYIIPAAATVVFILWKGAARTKWMLLALIFVFAVGDSVTTNILKPFFGRPRPYSVLEHIHVFKGSWMWSEAVAKHPTLSFPSAHAVNTAALAGVVIYFFRKVWLIPVCFVLLVCYSRVYTGVHYPSDVMFGVLAGAGCTGVYMALERFMILLSPNRFGRLLKEKEE